MKHTIVFFTFVSLLLLTCQNSTDSQNKASHSSKQKENTVYNADLIAKGKKIAQASFKAMSGKLMHAMQEGGVPNALKYCNLEAMPITDSLSKAYGVQIKRTALKLRNPKNKPNTEEFNLLLQFQSDIKLGKNPKPIIMKSGPHSNTFFAPITIKQPCLACHGDVNAETKKLIAEHYPEDKATGFKLGELRGMWSIKFDDK